MIKRISIIVVCIIFVSTAFVGAFTHTNPIQADSLRNCTIKNEISNQFTSSQNYEIDDEDIITKLEEAYSSGNTQNTVLGIATNCDYSCMCDWVDGHDHGPEKTEFNQCDETYYFASFTAAEVGDVFSIKWKYGDQIIFDYEWDPLTWSGAGSISSRRYPSRVGQWKCELYCNGVKIDTGPTFTIVDVPIELEYSCMCDWAVGYEDHGPPKSSFDQNDQVYYYAQVKYANYGDIFKLKTYYDGEICFTTTWNELTWSGSGSAYCYWDVYGCGPWNIEFFCNNNNILDDFTSFNVNDDPNIHYSPYDPNKPDGQETGGVDNMYLYTTTTSDLDYDDIRYGWDWDGDDNVDEWTDLIPNKQEISTSHLWTEKGIYNVKVKAKDEHDFVSGWSESLEVLIIDEPAVETKDVADISSTTAILRGTLVNDGGEACQVRFEYYKVRAGLPDFQYTEWQEQVQTGDDFSAEIEGLKPGCKYKVRAIANNSLFQVYDDYIEFWTVDNRPPDRPNKPEGPGNGAPGMEYSFSCFAADPEGDDVYFNFKFETSMSQGFGEQIDNSIPGVYGPYPSNEEVSVQNVEIPENLQANQLITISVRASNKYTNKDKFYSAYSEKTAMWLTNAPTNLVINGPSKGEVRKNYEYSFTADEPDGEEMYYFVDWGDNSDSGWLGPFSSGENLDLSHKWKEGKPYVIRFKAKDENDVECDWRTKGMSIPKQHERNQIISYTFLQRVCQQFKFIDILLTNLNLNFFNLKIQHFQ